MLLKDKVVVVSGIGPGLGTKLALEAAREGAAGIVLAARTESKLEDAEQGVAALGLGTGTLKCITDIREAGQCEAMAKMAVECFGRIDALVNSAFIPGPRELLSEGDLSGVAKALDTNLFGTLNMTRAVIPQMKRQKQGAIVMVSTMATRTVVQTTMGGYAISKLPLTAAVRHLAKELGPHGIRVNVTYNGYMWGSTVEEYVQRMAKRSGMTEAEVKADIARQTALGRIVTDDECARAVLFMVSDYASAVTGAGLDVNGGQYLP